MFEKDWVCTNRLGGSEAIRMYNMHLQKRRNMFSFTSKQHSDVIEKINKDGFCVVKSAIDKDLLLDIKKKAENVFMNSSRLKTNDKRYTTIRHPFVDLPEVLHLALSEPILNTVSQFYGCFPALTGGKVHRTHANKGPKKGTQLFHIDKNSLWFIKAFLYLNDVNSDGGPFTYVKGSHKNRFKGWRETYRYTDEQIESYYGKDNVIKVTASVGDLIFANTTGIHKAGIIESGHRTMITMNFCIHPEDWSPEHKYILIREHDYNSVDPKKKAVYDYTRKAK